MMFSVSVYYMAWYLTLYHYSLNCWVLSIFTCFNFVPRLYYYSHIHHILMTNDHVQLHIYCADWYFHGEAYVLIHKNTSNGNSFHHRDFWNVILHWLERLSEINLKTSQYLMNASSLDTQIPLWKQKTKYLSLTIAFSILNIISTSKSFLIKTTLM